MKIFTLYVVIIFISTCLSDIRITRRCESPVIFLFSVFRIGWPSCLFTSLCSLNTAQSIFQTLSHQETGTITLSAGSVLSICCYTSKLSFDYILTYLTCVHLFTQDISFTKVYKNAPSVFVSANHTSSGGGLDPMHNSITAWVEVSQSSAQLRAVNYTKRCQRRVRGAGICKLTLLLNFLSRQ